MRLWFLSRARDQHTRIGQSLDHYIIRIALLTLLGDDLDGPQTLARL